MKPSKYKLPAIHRQHKGLMTNHTQMNPQIVPQIIQGGMGVGVSSWQLAQAVSAASTPQASSLGVVSGTALDQVFARRLQDGDLGGHMRRALNAFPFQAMAARVWRAYFIAGGKAAHDPYIFIAPHSHATPRETLELTLVGNFAEVFLARESPDGKAGQTNPVGINYLEKIQAALLPSLYGAMLAGVDTVLIGAGIPLKVPGTLDLFANHQPATYPLHVVGALPDEHTEIHFNPADFAELTLPPLKRPQFLAIISSNTLAITLLKKANGRVDGFIIETHTAGGHNAPPRGKLQLTPAGEPIYTDRDEVDLPKLRDLNIPFWLAGGYGHPDKLREALAQGAAGIQVGTAFEFADESGLHPTYKQALLDKVISGTATIFTDPLASPTGFPFKLAELAGTASDPTTTRPRICNLGFLRTTYRTPEGTIGYRCAAEPPSLYIAKGGNPEDTAGRKCICNGLLANIGHPQILAGNHIEPALITAGDDLPTILQFLPPNQTHYTAQNVLTQLQKGLTI